MFDVITALTTNLFRTLIIRRFLSVFFPVSEVDKKKEAAIYMLFYFTTTTVYLAFHFPPANVIANLLMIYSAAQLYDGEQRKKILVSILVYGINMACDVLSVYSFSDYIFGQDYNEIAAYLTVLLTSICEYVAERFLIKRRHTIYTPPCGYVLILIAVISIVILFVLIMSNLHNRSILIIVSTGMIFINMLIFYLYNVLLDSYLKMEEMIVFERQVESYANQLDVLKNSEERISALRHDMRYHLNELLIMAQKNENPAMKSYIENMQMFMENKSQYSCSGNQDVDSILNYMLRKAQQVLRDVKYKISIPEKTGFQAFDLNIILGNLLENAIQAAKETEDKRLSVMVRYEKGMLFIEIQNSYSGHVVRQGREYLTTKKEAGQHGIGLRNVKRVVDIYHGSMNISDKDNVFDVKIMLYDSTAF